MRSDLLIGTTCLLWALSGCGESFVGSASTAGTGGAGAQGGATSNQGGGGNGGETGSTGGSGPTCGANGQGGCDACLFESCAAAYCACDDANGCFDLIGCYAGSPAPSFSYLQTCWQKHGAGIAAAGSLLACGGGACGACEIMPVGECPACMYEQCPQEVNACFALSDCSGLLKCVDDCAEGDDACLTDCAVTYQAGSQLAGDLNGCIQDKCVDACK